MKKNSYSVRRKRKLIGNLIRRIVNINPVLNVVRTKENLLKTQPSIFKEEFSDERSPEILLKETRKKLSSLSFLTGGFTAQGWQSCLSTQEKESKYQRLWERGEGVCPEIFSILVHSLYLMFYLLCVLFRQILLKSYPTRIYLNTSYFILDSHESKP